MKFSLLYTLLLFTIVSMGQTFTAKVVDQETNEPIPMVTVYSVEQQTGSITDHQGDFTLLKVPQTIVLQFSYVGYETLLVTVNTSEMNKVFYLQPGHLDLDEIVLSAPQSRLGDDNTIAIEQRSIQMLQASNPINLATAIANIPGVSQISTGSGIGKPVIRGLSGSRIVTYAQGIRLENQQWGAEHGLGVGDIGIESVEVIKGPASLLYGADALGGVLYFVDERYAKMNHTDLKASSQFLSNTLGTNNQFGVKLNKNKLKINLFGSYQSHADYKTPLGLNAHNTRFEEQNFKAAYGFGSNNWVGNLRYSFLKNKFGITEEDQAFSSTQDRNFGVPFQTIVNHNLSWDNTLYLGEGKIKGTLGYTSNLREEFEESTHTSALNMELNSFTYNLKWFLPENNETFDWIVGAQGLVQENTNHGEERLIPNATTNDIGVFVVTNASLDQWHFQGGLRFDQRQIQSESFTNEGEIQFEGLDVQFNAVNFAFGAAFEFDRAKIKFNLSSGFRAPNTSELLSNGVHEGTNQYVVGNSSLKSEVATQFDLALDINTTHFDFSIQPFYNTIKDYIFLTPSNTTIEGSPRFDYTQSDALLYGGELGFHYHPHDIHWLHLESDVSLVLAENRKGDPLPLIPAKRWRSTARAEWTGHWLTSIFLTYQHTASQSRVSTFETISPSYGLVDMGAQFKVKKGIILALALTNAFDTNYIDHLSRLKSLNVPNMGRNFSAKLMWQIEKI